MKIIIETRQPEDMRYDTLGDWYFEKAVVHIHVSAKDGDTPLTSEQQFLIALHELVESYLCSNRGITQEQVDEWDMQNSEGPEEPGDNINAPYRREHRFAMLIEHLMAHELGIQGYGEVK
jgi:hypothetical protein